MARSKQGSHKLDLTDEELRRVLYSIRTAGQEIHRLRLEDEVQVFESHCPQFGPQHDVRSLVDKLLKAAE
jgi:nicotinate-nucleotide pyrophosphorylase